MREDARKERTWEGIRSRVVTCVKEGSIRKAVSIYRRAYPGMSLDEATHAIAALVEQFGTEPPPCPHCGEKLRSPAAEQCFACGAEWHRGSTN